MAALPVSGTSIYFQGIGNAEIVDAVQLGAHRSCRSAPRSALTTKALDAAPRALRRCRASVGHRARNTVAARNER